MTNVAGDKKDNGTTVSCQQRRVSEVSHNTHNVSVTTAFMEMADKTDTRM